MKSGKQRRKELDAKRQARGAKKATQCMEAARGAAAAALAAGLAVNRVALTPHNSYSNPDFVARGYYLDRPFTCIDCGKTEVWTAGQQKWWYEVAKGSVFTTARRCRACRRRERTRRSEARQIHLEGIARKKSNRLRP